MTHLDPDHLPGDGERAGTGCLLCMLSALIVGVILAVLVVTAW